jgi:hypothetical protein
MARGALVLKVLLHTNTHTTSATGTRPQLRPKTTCEGTRHWGTRHAGPNDCGALLIYCAGWCQNSSKRLADPRRPCSSLRRQRSARASRGEQPAGFQVCTDGAGSLGMGTYWPIRRLCMLMVYSRVMMSFTREAFFSPFFAMMRTTRKARRVLRQKGTFFWSTPSSSSPNRQRALFK